MSSNSSFVTTEWIHKMSYSFLSSFYRRLIDIPEGLLAGLVEGRPIDGLAGLVEGLVTGFVVGLSGLSIGFSGFGLSGFGGL